MSETKTKYVKLPPWTDKFMDLLAKYGVQEHARRGVDADKRYSLKSSGSIVDWKKNNREFAKRFDEAKIRHQELLEGELTRRAVYGRDEPVVYRGQIQYQRNPASGVLLKDEDDRPIPVVVKRYSDTLLLAKLKAEMPSKYGGNDVIALTAMRDAKDSEDHVAPSKEELKRRLLQLREGKKAELELLQGGKKSG